MSPEYAHKCFDFLTVEQNIFLSSTLSLKNKDIWLSFDLDGVLAKSEIPVFDYCDYDLGTNYSGRKLTGFGSVAKWLIEDKVFKNIEEAEKYEFNLWDNTDIIAKSPPNKAFQNFSILAHNLNIPQIITTSRPPKLVQMTENWVNYHFPKIQILNIRHNKRLGGEAFKARNVGRLYRWNRNTVHFDDSMSHLRKIVKTAPNIGIIAFPYHGDDIKDIAGATNRVFLPDIAIFEQLVAQCH